MLAGSLEGHGEHPKRKQHQRLCHPVVVHLRFTGTHIKMRPFQQEAQCMSSTLRDATPTSLGASMGEA
eukprot:3498748-Amphidinium_carterae.1